MYVIFDYDSHRGILNLEFCYFHRPEEKRVEYSIYEKYGIDPLEELWFWEETLEAIKSSDDFDKKEPTLAFSVVGLPNLRLLLRHRNRGRKQSSAIVKFPLDKIQSAAMCGCAYAQKLLGDYYATPVLSGSDYNLEESVNWYKEAASHGLTNDLFHMGELWVKMAKTGKAEKLDAAMSCYRLSADFGDMNAKKRLALFYLIGYGAQKDIAAALAFAREALQYESEDVMAQCTMDICMALKNKHRNYKVDFSKFRFLNAEDADMLYNLALYCETALQEYKDAFFLYKCAAKSRLPKAQCALGRCYETGAGTRRDIEEAARLYGRAARQGLAEAQYALACCYEKTLKLTAKEPDVIRLYQYAAEKGLADAQYALATRYEAGLGLEQNFRQAMRLYKLAAKQGNISAMESLRKCYWNGVGVRQNKPQAKKWEERIASAKREQANRSILPDSQSHKVVHDIGEGH